MKLRAEFSSKEAQKNWAWYMFINDLIKGATYKKLCALIDSSDPEMNTLANSMMTELYFGPKSGSDDRNGEDKAELAG